MATGILHHIGTFLLFASAILLLIPTISAPVIKDIALLKVTGIQSHTSVISFGTFGYCVLGVDSNPNQCTKKHIGYNPASTISTISTPFSTASENTSKALTRVMILHPIACGLMFIAFLLALGASIIGSFLAALVSGIAFVVALVAVACDFVLFGIVKRHVNSNGSVSGEGGHASFSAGIWCLVAGMVVGFLGAGLVFATCLSKRIHGRKSGRTGMGGEKGYVGGVRPAKRHFWQRRNRY
ncbi:hypothetical protein SBOR_4101 [Sclerotinia borealis F-4128]|uniref:Pali-domain-containing protein n=1 Tax=Sclerotinia borealis (strain F-4128) TaxID=1432307 RepID=W9CI21_SCLBF|nr:hypothetical protein SBOR_4101 [Sclerotinia borealis F-4128]